MFIQLDGAHTQHPHSTHPVDDQRVEPVAKRREGDPTTTQQELLKSVEAETLVQLGSVIYMIELDGRR